MASMKELCSYPFYLCFRFLFCKTMTLKIPDSGTFAVVFYYTLCPILEERKKMHSGIKYFYHHLSCAAT